MTRNLTDPFEGFLKDKKYLTKEFLEHYHKECAHQGLDNEIIEPPLPGTGEIVCQKRLGGLLKFYRKAA